ncbi:GntR family transcriptional regulator [Actinacidiphila glaucinigra]|uniref:GntR family transcriptional regulator n=1 Tax=Actinacidiphila glaucinigra TaxID=235986 RepID=A0A239KM84_9ACTN|nr:GntR family transcriptional regulator [Actinacidiphila glaucinigra]SNT19466.1 GntR family transcriptional regulator [Actinacidiphila glaucinigra]
MPREAPYLEVADDLRRRIKAGEWGIGEKLPSGAVLATEYNVGRNVTQRALDRLVIEGLLEGRAGSGRFVRPPRERMRMIRSRHREHRGGSPFHANMDEQGKAGTWESHSQARVPASEDVAQRLAIQPGDHCVRTTYEFMADGQPVQLSTSWEPMVITDGTPIVLPEMGPLAGEGVVKRMRTIGVTVDTAVEVPRPGRATQEEANLLGISVGDLLMRIERTYYDGDGRPVETADLVVPDVRWEIAYEIGIDRGE